MSISLLGGFIQHFHFIFSIHDFVMSKKNVDVMIFLNSITIYYILKLMAISLLNGAT